MLRLPRRLLSTTATAVRAVSAAVGQGEAEAADPLLLSDWSNVKHMFGVTIRKAGSASGNGLFATRPFARGETVFHDRAIVTYPPLHATVRHPTRSVHQSVNQLWPTPELQCSYCLKHHNPSISTTADTPNAAQKLYKIYREMHRNRSRSAAASAAASATHSGNGCEYCRRGGHLSRRLHHQLETEFPLPIPELLQPDLMSPASVPVRPLPPGAISLLQHFGVVRISLSPSLISTRPLIH